MSLALLGLVFVQIYWSLKSIELHKQIFKDTVDQAMSEVVFKVNKQEISSLVLHYKQNAKILQKVDSLNNILEKLKTKYPDILFEERSFSQTYQDNFILSEPPMEPDSIEAWSQEKKASSSIKKRRVQHTYRAWEKERNLLLQNSRLMDDLLREAMKHAPKQNLLQRIDPYVIDSLISFELAKKGIHTQVEWGIFSRNLSKLVVRRSKDYGVRLLQSRLFYQLFPNDSSPNSYFLVIGFPNQKIFIASQMWHLSIVAIVLLIIQILAFIYTLRSVIRQHKFSEQKTNFINHITHEIKTPVSTISLICESFNDPDIGYNEAEVKNLLAIINHESKRLQLLSRKIIEISNLERGVYQLNMSECDLHEIIQNAINNSGFQIMLNNGRIETELTAKTSSIFGDKERLISVFSNLIENANKYAEEAPYIVIKSRNINSTIEITVSDNGIGMSKNQLAKIFDKLYRIPTGNTHNAQGFGLGLSFVKSIMEQHKGTVSVESELKKGSTFSLIFPQNSDLQKKHL